MIAMGRYQPRTPDAGIAGVDEAGRGPLAGPLVVAAVMLHPDRCPEGLDDSKRLSASRRTQLFEAIMDLAEAVRIEVIAPAVIDRRNIFHATMDGMRAAVAALRHGPRLALIDGNRIPPDMPCPAEALVRGDAREPAISAASILAKVTRDRILDALHADFPAYGFDRHKGYPTPEHLEALRRLGPCAAHRRSFAPVRAACAPDLGLLSGR